MFLSLKIALKSLAAHRLRAALAVLGVFLGALALTGVQHMSEAMVRKAEVETEKLGPNLFVVRSGQVRFRRGGEAAPGADTRTFTVADAQALVAKVPSALDGTPFATRTMPVRAGNSKVNAQLVAAWPNYQDIRNFRPDIGRFFTWEELEAMDRVVVLGRTIAERLFLRPEDALGRSVFLFRAEARVVGVMEAKGADLSGTNQDEQIFVPLTTYMRRFANVDRISGVYIRLADGADFELARESARLLMRQRHRLAPIARDDFSVLTARDTIRLQREALDLVQTLGLISSSISFAVGGLGILSIMILLVRTRRLEIGVRRAMGARRQDIIRQFLFESGFMSIVGGGLGTAGGLVLVTVIYKVGDFPYVYDPLLILAALAGSALLGLASGAYPAWQASRVEILDVLRSFE